jgi:tetratricopeptide (TPR) repeat protein
LRRYLRWLLVLALFSCQKNKITKTPSVKNLYYDRAWYFADRNMVDSSFVYFNKAKEEALTSKDSLIVAKCLIHMAIIIGDQGDYYGSQELSVSVLKFLNPKDSIEKEILSSNYNNLGKMAHNLRNHQEANLCYLKSIELSKNENSRFIYINNIATNLKDQKRCPEAIKYFERLLKSKNIRNNKNNFSRVLDNMAYTKWLGNTNYKAAPKLLEALQIRIRAYDLWGQNASYAHLATFYTRSKPDSALFYSYKMYAVANRLESADDRLGALQKLVKLSPSEESKRYFSIYQNLNDSIQTARNAAKNQFAMIRFDTEKNKASNLMLLKENTERKYQLVKQQMFFLIAGLIVLSGLIISILWYKKRKQNIELNAEKTIHESQLKTSKKVHDVVANGLYRVMAEIENRDSIDKEDLLDRIEILYEKSRDISYEQEEATQPFYETISALLTAFATDQTKILIAGNTAALWESVNLKVKYEVEHILQELMVNMKKHSGADKTAIRFENKHHWIHIYYRDNGIGIQEGLHFNNGLRNTGNRINDIDGAITFDTNVEKGLNIKISFPVS